MEAMLLEAIHASNDGFPKNKCRFAVYSDLHQNWFLQNIVKVAIHTQNVTFICLILMLHNIRLASNALVATLDKRKKFHLLTPNA